MLLTDEVVEVPDCPLDGDFVISISNITSSV